MGHLKTIINDQGTKKYAFYPLPRAMAILHTEVKVPYFKGVDTSHNVYRPSLGSVKNRQHRGQSDPNRRRSKYIVQLHNFTTSTYRPDTCIIFIFIRQYQRILRWMT